MTRSLLISTQLIFIIALMIIPTTFGQNQSIQEDPAAIQDAHDLYYARKYAEAITAYQVLLKTPLRQNTQDAIRMNMGRSYKQLGKDALAIQTFQAIIEEDPNGSYANQAIYQIGNLFVQRYQYREAILSCRQLAEKYPDTRTAGMAHYLISQYLHSAGKYDEAIESYRSFLKDYPELPYRVSALRNLVQLYLARRMHNEAEKLLRDHLHQNPDDTDLMEQLADLYRQQEKHSEALSLYRAALERDPNNTSLIKKLGEFYAERGQRNQAIDEWSKIIQSDSNEAYRYQQLGTIYIAHQMYDEAIQVYQTALRLNPKNGYLYTQLADVYKIQGQIDMAINTYLQALNAIDIGYSGRDRIIESIDEIYEGKQRERLFGRITARIQNDLKANPQNPNLVLALAEIYFYHGRLALALENFKRLHKLYPPDRGRILEKYAQILERKKHPKAADFYRAIIELFPNSRLAWNSQMKLARLYVQMGRWQGALAVLTDMTQRHQDVSAQLLLGDVWLHGLRGVESAMRIYQALTNQRLTAAQQEEVRLRLAECHTLQERYVAAQNMLRPIADGHSAFKAEARKLIGDLHLFQGRFEEAIAAYKSVLDIAMSDLLSNDALNRIVLIQSNSDYINEPLKLYVKGLQVYLKGQAEVALKLCVEAIDAYSDAHIVDDLWLLIADIHQEQGRHTDAIEAYHQVIAVESPGAAEAQGKIAEIYREQLGDLAKAQETYSALIENYPESVIVAYARQQIDEIMKLQPE